MYIKDALDKNINAKIEEMRRCIFPENDICRDCAFYCEDMDMGATIPVCTLNGIYGDVHCNGCKNYRKKGFANLEDEDLVRVVRCKDCKNCWKCGWSHSVGDLYGCTVFDSEVRPNDFCSHGERKENGT